MCLVWLVDLLLLSQGFAFVVNSVVYCSQVTIVWFVNIVSVLGVSLGMRFVYCIVVLKGLGFDRD